MAFQRLNWRDFFNQRWIHAIPITGQYTNKQSRWKKVRKKLHKAPETGVTLRITLDLKIRSSGNREMWQVGSWDCEWAAGASDCWLMTLTLLNTALQERNCKRDRERGGEDTSISFEIHKITIFGYIFQGPYYKWVLIYCVFELLEEIEHTTYVHQLLFKC